MESGIRPSNNFFKGNGLEWDPLIFLRAIAWTNILSIVTWTNCSPQMYSWTNQHHMNSLFTNIKTNLGRTSKNWGGIYTHKTYIRKGLVFTNIVLVMDINLKWQNIINLSVPSYTSNIRMSISMITSIMRITWNLTIITWISDDITW